MASANLTQSGKTDVLKATAYVTEVTTSGTSRSVRLRLTVKSVDYSGNRDGNYYVYCQQADDGLGTVSCVYSGTETTIYDKTFTVSLNSDNTTANINLTFEASVYSASAGGYRTITGSITRLTLTRYYPPYTLTISASTGSSITVNRTSSPNGASLGTLKSGATIYQSDVLKITFTVNVGYDLITHTVNGSSFTSGDSHTVSGNVRVVTVTEQLGLVYIDNGTNLEACLIFIDNGTTQEQYVPYIDNGTSWELYS